MAPKGGNAKKEGGRAKKAENEEKKQAAASKAKEAKEADEWKAGAKGSSKADAAAAKAAEAARKKAEKEALLAAEEASLPNKGKSAPKAGAKKKNNDKLTPTGLGVAGYAINDPLGLRKPKGVEEEETKELSAKGLDEMLDAMEIVNQKTDKAAVGAKAEIMIDAHPERRFKAAFEAYLDREMPILKEEHKGLRQNQMRDILYKQFQKSPENPFNQAKIAYNATREEKVEAYKGMMEQREAKLSRFD
ncbi:hypothetical protein L202_01259 [Cryptococcus amylolentus CBS 6039]|uniref:DUF1014 domain-containing protein n=2 Tax=Cryptococcus amylolentus TaxID=104669 RepID=A0A1E3I301_9TREE|nr:hypothetical protein L202_01259 [Cryptococcus amylolentus CBS 6039]ODN83033.1 hypothetical protein L202_01259 [Cryptococcus amylolentus CBS 6039]ODO10650.1 hypothetical protein I350_01247 [Cryptococcus amylolentus CBS 6273]